MKGVPFKVDIAGSMRQGTFSAAFFVPNENDSISSINKVLDIDIVLNMSIPLAPQCIQEIKDKPVFVKIFLKNCSKPWVDTFDDNYDFIVYHDGIFLFSTSLKKYMLYKFSRHATN